MLVTDTPVVADAGVTLKVVSQGGGRMRVRASGFDFDEVRAVAIEDAVAKVAGVRAVQAYPRSASVVVWYLPDDCDTAAVLSSIAEAQHIPAELVPARAPHSADADKTGVVQKITGGILRLLGLSPDVDTLDATGGGSSCHQPAASCHGAPVADAKGEQRKWLRRVWLAVPLGLVSMAAPMLFGGAWAGWLAFAATVPVQFVAGWPFLVGAVQQARAGSAGMDTLISLGTLTAFAYSTYQLFVGGAAVL